MERKTSGFELGNQLSWFRKFCVNVMKCGPVPRHLAVIMDGNRRYARQKKMEISEGHAEGAEKLKLLTLWCRELDIKELTVYAFSTENFKRTPQEVKALMDVLRQNFQLFLDDMDTIKEQKIRIRAVGHLALLPADVRRVIAKTMLMTKDNDRFTLNIACAYTSREEITNAIKIVVDGVRSGILHEEDINQELLSNCMYTNYSPDPDLLIRTSGEVRFSDFLLWQTQYSQVYFEKICWPEMSLLKLLILILRYQMNLQRQQSASYFGFIPGRGLNARSKKFIESVNSSRLAALEEFAQD